ncbi:MAG: O-antigen ligase family protein [Candidatus Shapirobacteria bacterium]
MALISKIILYLLAISFAFGQLARINIFNTSIPIVDFLILALVFFNLLGYYRVKHLKITNKPLLFFLLFAWISFGINLIIHHYPPLKPLLYLLRLTGLLSLFILPLNKKLLSQKFHLFLSIALIANIIFGFIQYFFWPDFTYFETFNWDPHLYRLVSTFFDPTFTGLIYLLFFFKIFLSPTKNKVFKYFLLIITYLAMSLTYSRSSLLAFWLTSLFVSFRLKKPIISAISTILIILTIILLPRQPGEGTRLQRTSSVKAKIENYQEGVSVFLKSPIIGHGYNNLYYVREVRNPVSHANFGFDSSLLTILSATGIIGFILFILGLKKTFISSTPILQTELVAVLIHSLFSNSLLYPWILTLLLLN